MIHLATSHAFPTLTDDDRLLVDALSALGLPSAPLDWRSEPIPRRGDTVVVRSCWEYHLYPDDFIRWIDRLAAEGVAIGNGARTLRWNLHKRYLLELAQAGTASIPGSLLLERGAAVSLEAAIAALGSDDLVVKPAISLSGHRTWRTHGTPRDAAAQRLAAQLTDGDTLLQRYMPQIETDGELSLVFIGSEYSHAVRKRPATGEFRVQADFGGSREPADVDAAIVQQAADLLAAAQPDTLYARVDGLVIDGQWWLMELELVDPVLFFRMQPGAAVKLAEAIAALSAVRGSR